MSYVRTGLHTCGAFQGNCFAWAALNYFLPADLLRELLDVLVAEVSGGQLRLNELFEERLIDGPESLRSWAARPRDYHPPSPNIFSTASVTLYGETMGRSVFREISATRTTP